MGSGHVKGCQVSVPKRAVAPRRAGASLTVQRAVPAVGEGCVTAGQVPGRLLRSIHLLLPDLLPAPPHLACLPAKLGPWEGVPGALLGYHAGTGQSEEEGARSTQCLKASS